MSTKRNAPGQGSLPKRARFESPSTLETAATDFFEDDVGNQSKKSKDKRTLVGREGYDSDSTDDGEGVVPSRKTAHGEDLDDDMFGGVAEAQETTSAKDAINNAEKEAFLDLADIEGQDFRHSKEDDSDYDSEEEARKQAEAQGLDGPMGFQMTGFNMKTELGEGKMTADGETFVMNDKDPNEQYDKWLDGVDRDAMKKARKAHREQERVQRERQEKEERELSGEARKERERNIMREIVELLERGETVLEGLQRLGKEMEKKSHAVESSSGHKKKSWIERQRERKALLQGEAGNSNDMQVDSANSHAADPHHQSPFARLNDLVSSLTSLGHLDVYSMTREAMQRMSPPDAPRPAPSTSQNPSRPISDGLRDGRAARGTQPIPPDTRAFEYRFSKKYLGSLPEGQRPLERDVFGPFPLRSLMEWRATGAFGGPECENIELRVKGEVNGDWGSWQQIMTPGLSTNSIS
ncbi:hypothetical protein QFC19_004993 [Naganishia cerealis]|uniref:Uncharacterized protein n=1 Tax=Naganishia cerealis TaxID=610337 RepID=A0ACC2VU03_9TREE|nr:hypothetical protein QFC19_004993 [Naganishia cerealis]